jgi:iron(III) transport system ATP-binding protein
VALARALVSQSPLILFDEPLSNVDAKVRDQLRGELALMQHELGFAGLYVTHDQREAFGLGRRIAVMNSGRIEQLGTPQEIYQKPSSLYVARFVGTTNEVPGEVISVAGGVVEARTAIGTLVGKRGAQPLTPGDSVVAVFRPEVARLESAAASLPAGNRWTGRVVSTVFEGASAIHDIRVGEQSIRVGTVAVETGELTSTDATVGVDKEHVLVLPNIGHVQ